MGLNQGSLPLFRLHRTNRTPAELRQRSDSCCLLNAKRVNRLPGAKQQSEGAPRVPESMTQIAIYYTVA
jgi:hypothetical protein